MPTGASEEIFRPLTDSPWACQANRQQRLVCFGVTVHFLLNAVPGLRDVRGPLTAGYLWLAFAWLLISPDINTRPDTRVGGTVFDVAKHVGPLWIAFALSTVAYIAGAVSQEMSEGVRWLLLQIGGRSMRLQLLTGGFGAIYDPASQVRPIHSRGVVVMKDFRRRMEQQWGDQRPDELDEAVAEAEQDLERELQAATDGSLRMPDLPATLIVTDQPLLYSEVDRLRAESELRLAVTPPIIALAIVLALNSSTWWLLLIPAAALLFTQALRRRADSRQLIIDAMSTDRITPPAIERFSTWVDATAERLDALYVESRRKADAGPIDGGSP